jgi:hypothetical protein
MSSRDTNDGPVGARGWDAEGVPFSLHDEHGQPHSLEFGESALCRVICPARRMQGKRQADDGDRARRRRGAAGHPGARRAAADDQGKFAQRPAAQLGDHREPAGVELMSRRWSAPASYLVGLFNQRDAQAGRSCGPRRGR